MRIACFSNYSPLETENQSNSWVGLLYKERADFSESIMVDHYFIRWTNSRMKLSTGKYSEFEYWYKIEIPTFFRLSKPLFVQPCVRRLLRNSEIAAGSYDILHVHTLFYSFVIDSSTKKTFSVLHIHENPMLLESILRNNKYSCLENIKKYDSLIRPSHVNVELLEKLNPIVRVIPNAFDAELFASEDCKCMSTVDKTTPTVLSVGSLRKIKNYSLALLSIREYLNNYGSINYEIVGTGPEEKKLTRMINKLRLNSNVKLCGRLDQKEIKDKLNYSSLLLNTSFFESFGVSIVEALGVGCPVVSSADGGPRYIFDLANRSSVDIGDFVEPTPMSIAKAIHRNVNRSGSERSKLSRFSSSYFSSRSFIHNLIELSRDVCKGIDDK